MKSSRSKFGGNGLVLIIPSRGPVMFCPSLKVSSTVSM